MNRVVAVVVTYNRKKLLIECVRHLEAQSVNCDILIIDNASSDGTADALSNYSQKVIYINTGKNLGGAGGFSFGIKKAVELGYDYLWILDDDTMPSTTALECFLKRSNELEGKYGYLSSKVLWKDNSVCVMNRQKKTKWKKIKDFDAPQKIQYASFVSLFIEATTVRHVGLPYKEFFIWADDWEYTRRISKKYPCYYIPESIVNHWCISNVGADIVTTDISRVERFKYMYRNDVTMYRQDGIEGLFYLLVRNLLHIVRILLKSSRKKDKIVMMWRATLEGIKFSPEIDYPEEKKYD